LSVLICEATNSPLMIPKFCSFYVFFPIFYSKNKAFFSSILPFIRFVIQGASGIAALYCPSRQHNFDVILSKDSFLPLLSNSSVFLPSIINRMLQEGHEGDLVTGICAGRTNRETVDFNNISCNTAKVAMEYFNFHEEGTLRRV
jgi:hypothetical protein